VWLRDRDMTNGWRGAADGNLEERTFYCQNWRADVVALISSSGQQVQQVRYGEYGEAFGLPRGDADGDRDVDNGDTVDTDQIQTWISGGAGAYDVRGDLDLDGDVDVNDKAAAGSMAGTVLGWGAMSLTVGSSGGGNRKGYAGYENDGVLADSQFYHVRNRVYHAGLGRWLTRDPAGYLDGPSAYAAFRMNPLAYFDPSGMLSLQCTLDCIACVGVGVGGAGTCAGLCVTAGVWTGGAACYFCIMAYVGTMAWLAPNCWNCVICIANAPPGQPSDHVSPHGSPMRLASLDSSPMIMGFGSWSPDVEDAHPGIQ
jgi:RHS repeat-associated protein